MTNLRIQLVMRLIDLERYPLAAGCCRESLAENPEDARSHALLSVCMVHLKEYMEATDQATSAIELAPEDPFAYVALCYVYWHRGYFREAETSIRQALRLAPGCPDYWGTFAELAFRGDRWQSALHAANKGLEIYPDHEVCLNVRAMVLAKVGANVAAAATIAASLQRNPCNSKAHANMGWTLLQQDELRSAEEHFLEALRIDPNNLWAAQGLRHALKARYVLYHFMMRYYLRMSRFTCGRHLRFLLGWYVYVLALYWVQTSRPALYPFCLLLMAASIAFVLMSRLADVLFDVAFLIDSTRRSLLSTSEKTGAVAVTLLLLFAIVLLPVEIFFDHSRCLGSDMMMALLTLPVSTTPCPQFDAPFPHKIIYASVVVSCGVVGFLLILAGVERGFPLLLVGVWGAVMSSFASYVLWLSARGGADC